MRSRWYVVRTQARADHLVASEMSNNGFEVFAPRVVGVDGQRRDVETSLFPGYLFLHSNLEEDRLPSFPKTGQIIGWLKFGDDVAWVPDQVVDEIRKRSETIIREGGIRNRFQSGDLVRVVSGTLQGLAEVVEEGKSVQSKVRVLLEFMGRQVITQISGFDLQPIDDQPSDMPRKARRTRGKGRFIRRPEDIPLARG